LLKVHVKISVLIFYLFTIGCQNIQIIDLGGKTMGTTYSISIVNQSNNTVNVQLFKEQIDSVLLEISNIFSTYIENSEINGINKKITYDNAFKILKGYDAVVDGTDNFSVRYAVNDACMVNKIPVFHGAVLMYEGRATSIIPEKTACFRCIFPEAPPQGLVPTCREAGVIGSMTGLIGSIQAMETVRYIVGHKIGLLNRLLIVNADTMDFYKVKIVRREDCTACGSTFVPKPVDEVCEISVEPKVKGDE